MPPRVQLLVSVRSATEALAALEGGADIIDVKEPSRGPLGMADADVMRAVVDAVGGRVPVSVAMGELCDKPPMSRIPAGVAFAKIGLAGTEHGWETTLAATFAEAPNVKAIAVAYYNHSIQRRPPLVEAIVQWAIDRRLYGVLFDTYMKDRGHLFELRRILRHRELETHLRALQIAEYVRNVQKAGLTIALAGSLRDSMIGLALDMRPNIIGVRGAVCAGNNRKAAVDAERVRGLADLIAAHNAQTVATAG